MVDFISLPYTAPALTRTNPQQSLSQCKTFRYLWPCRGVQYASKEYQKLLKKNGYICSMSRKGNCYDNAPMESFWGKLKTEWLYGKRFKPENRLNKLYLSILNYFTIEKDYTQLYIAIETERRSMIQKLRANGRSKFSLCLWVLGKVTFQKTTLFPNRVI